MPTLTSVGLLLGLLACLGTAQSGLLNGLDHALSAREELSTFRDLLSRYPRILLDLSNYAGFTVVAPSNDAFEKYQNWHPNDEFLMTDILAYHILQGKVSIAAIHAGIPAFAPTLLKDGASTNINGGQRVIINNQGNGEVVFTSAADTRSTVLEGDIEFSDGMLHIVDTLLVPPSRLEPLCHVHYPLLHAFLAALYRTDLIDQAANTRDVTIFAPWDAAFQLTSGALSGLYPSELRDVLRYHIVPDRVLYSTDLTNATTWPTLLSQTGGAMGSPVNITATFAGNNRYIDSSQILHADILLANGVVHMMENVLNPARPDLRPNPSRYTQAPAFELVGSTKTGTRFPVPFTEVLPCTGDCSGAVVTTSATKQTLTTSLPATSSEATRFSSSSVAGVGDVAKCTGLVKLMSVGVIGGGMLAIVGVL